jgi:hypothetical protein
MNLGGPVWHASAAPTEGSFAGETRCRSAAFDALEGVGAASMGEWHEWTGAAYHVRRRLTDQEQARVGAVVDVRGSAEAAQRVARIPIAVRRLIPAYMLADEAGLER